MNQQQKYLLQLLVEIDDICQKHNITYYTAGGTVIGAVRHGGFIPWDDDIDVYMTRREFLRFREAFQKENLKNRSLESRYDNPEYYATIARYTSAETTMICRYHMIGESVAGTLIDIFILDPFPNDGKEQQEFYAKLNIYSDLVVMPYSHSHRNPDETLHYLETYEKRVKEEGFDAVVSELENELFSYDEDVCDQYLLRWGSRPTIIPKKMLGTPVWYPFEGYLFPMPEDWYGYLTQLYGSDWVMVPQPEEQDTHTAIVDLETPYTFFMKEREHYVSDGQIRELYWKKKHAFLNAEKAMRPAEGYLLTLKADIARTLLQETIEENKTQLTAWREEKNYPQIASLYNDFAQTQQSPLFIGRIEHGKWRRYLRPYIIPLPDAQLREMLYAMLMSGKDNQANRIVEAYKRAGIWNTVLEEAKGLFEQIVEIEKLYYTGAYAECFAKVQAFPEYQNNVKCMRMYYLSGVQTDAGKALAQELCVLAESKDASYEILKAYADLLWAGGRTKEAANVYRKVYDGYRNGMFWMDIEKKLRWSHDFTKELDTDSYHPTAIEEREKECLDEICAICDKYGIYYILHSNVTNLLLLNGTLGPDARTKAIYMDITAAKQFMEAFEKEQPENRALLSWKNQPYLDRFMLVYTDTGSVCTDFRTYAMTRQKGAHIDIILLRGIKNGIDPKRELLQKEELYLKAVTGRLTAEEKGADTFLSKLYKKGTAAMAADLFEEILAEDAAADEEGYFFRRIAPLPDAKEFMKTTRYAIEEYRYTELIQVGGRQYRVRQYLKDTFETADKSRLGGTPYNESIFTYRNAGLSWSRLDELVDATRLNSFDWNKMADALADRKAANDAILKIWLQMYSTKDKYDLWKSYCHKIPELRRLLRKQDLKALKKEMAAYDSTARFYLKNKIHFFINPELTECYVGFLRLLEKDKRADKIARAAKKNNRWMF